VKRYPLNEPSLSPKEYEYVKDVLDSNWLSAGGKHTKEFERLFAEYINVKYAIAVQSGTAALHIAMKTIGVTRGDNVIIPNYSCGATISSVRQCGATPIVLDIEMDTFGLCADSLENAIVKYRPKAIQLVHVYGFPARDTMRIMEIAKKYNVFLIEDSSEALGATLEGKMIGSLGDISTFSIRSEKMIGVGEGGVVTTNHKSLFNKMLSLSSRSAPFRTSASNYWQKYYYDGEGYNYRLPHLLGAIARAQIERFPEILHAKKSVGEMFKRMFGENSDWTIQGTAKDSEPVYWLNTIYLSNFTKSEVISLGEHLMENSVEVRSGFWPLSDMAAFSPESYGVQDNATNLFEKLLVLPSAYHLSSEDISHIFALVQNHIKKDYK
jgi:perosamine synthetase